MTMSDSDLVGTAEAAARAGVSERKADRYGKLLGTAGATTGTGVHRRWSPDDVAALTLVGMLTDAGVPVLAAADAARQVRPKLLSATADQLIYVDGVHGVVVDPDRLAARVAKARGAAFVVPVAKLHGKLGLRAGRASGRPRREPAASSH